MYYSSTSTCIMAYKNWENRLRVQTTTNKTKEIFTLHIFSQTSTKWGK